MMRAQPLSDFVMLSHLSLTSVSHSQCLHNGAVTQGYQRSEKTELEGGVLPANSAFVLLCLTEQAHGISLVGHRA